MDSRSLSHLVPHTHVATVTNVVDGDTVDVIVDLDFRITHELRVRLYGVDTPERGQPNYLEAATFVRDLILGKSVILDSQKPYDDKYGRYLANIHTLEGVNVSDALIAAGLGVAYFGVTVHKLGTVVAH